MTGHQNSNAKQRAGSGKQKKWLSCIQINLQHSRLATDKLLKIIQKMTQIFDVFRNHMRSAIKLLLTTILQILRIGRREIRADIVINNRLIYY
jgi:hypothetical protein